MRTPARTLGMSAPSDRALRRARSLASHVTASSTGRDGSGPGSTESPESWVRREGERFGPGEWLVVDQTRVDAFAECTEDHQWIHRAGAATPFGGPIAHGFLTL
jgi:acyl dehydratase